MIKKILSETDSKKIKFIEDLRKVLKSYNLIINISENLDKICIYENDVVPIPAICEINDLVTKKWKLRYDVKIFAKGNQVCLKISEN